MSLGVKTWRSAEGNDCSCNTDKTTAALLQSAFLPWGVLRQRRQVLEQMKLWKWVGIKACLEEFSEFPFGRPKLETALGTMYSWLLCQSLQKAWVFTGWQTECGAKGCVLCGEITWIKKKQEIQIDDLTPGWRRSYRIKQMVTRKSSRVNRNCSCE